MRLFVDLPFISWMVCHLLFPPSLLWSCALQPGAVQLTSFIRLSLLPLSERLVIPQSSLFLNYFLLGIILANSV